MIDVLYRTAIWADHQRVSFLDASGVVVLTLFVGICVGDLLAALREYRYWRS